MCRRSEFKINKIINISQTPTLVWFDKPYALEGHDATNFMLIKQFIDLKLKDIELCEKFKPLTVLPKEETKIEVVFEQHPQFRVDYLNFKAIDEAAAEALTRVEQVKEGKSQYDAMLDAFTIMRPKDRKKFLEELEAAEPDMLPFAGSYEVIEDVERPVIELEMQKPDIKKDIFAIERFITPKQWKEEKIELMKKPPIPEKKVIKGTKGKKGKGGKKGVKKGGKKGVVKGGKKGVGKGGKKGAQKGGKKGGKKK